MKSVIMIRHIKSDWSNVIPDYDRPVRQDRIEDAILIAKEIIANKNVPELVICSPAKRTLETATILCNTWDMTCDMVMDNTLYECRSADILTAINKVGNEYDTIAIVCHNPSITDFVTQYGNTYIANVPTTGAVCINFDVDDWKDIVDKGRTACFLRPKQLSGVKV